MILHSAFAVLLSMFFMSTSSLVSPLFNLIGLPVGLRSVMISAAMLATAMLALRSSNSPGLSRDVVRTTAVWLPWLIYAAIRCDFDDTYARTYLGKLVIIQFFSVIALTIMYRSNPREFDRFFIPALVLVGMGLGIKALVNPDVFFYETYIERATIEGVNPIWLARSFAVAGICMLFIPIKPLLPRMLGAMLFGAAIVPTGSRGPLLAMILVVGLYLSMRYVQKGRLVSLLLVTGVVSVIASLIFGQAIYNDIQDYLSRGTSANMLEESGRLMLFARAFGEFLSSPFVGVGLGEFGRSGFSFNFSSNIGSYPHNLALELLSTLGLIGLILFTLALRPGRWLTWPRGPYFSLFLISFLFSMTSGDLTANSGVIFFAVLTRLSYQPAVARTRRPFGGWAKSHA